MRVHLLLLLCLVLSIYTNAEAFTNNDCPTILYPAPYQTDVDINDILIWESQPDETYYLSLGITPNGKEIMDSLYLGNTDFYIFEYLTHNTTYYANIQIVGDTLNECEPIIFTTGDVSIPGCSEILTPPDGLIDVMINTPLIWLDVDNILGYYVQVGTTSGAHDVINADVIENHLYFDELEYDTDYFVNITPYNEYAVAVGCPEQRFTTMPAPPTNPELIITCPENIVVIESQGTGQRVVSFGEPQVTHSCSENSNVNIQQITGDPSGSSFPIGTTTIMYEVRLDCNSTIHLDTCQFEIIVEADNPMLLADCGSSQPFTIPDTDESIPVTWQLPTASTSCPGGEIVLQQIAGPPIGSNFTDGQSETITYTISDNCGNSTTCSFEVIAQKNQGNCPTNIQDYIFLGEYNGHRYLQSEFQLNWQDASDAAAQLGGYLVSIDSKEENKFITNKIDKILFIGLSDFQTEGTNTWDSGETITYNNFIGNNNQADDYGTIHFWNGKWEFVNVLVDKEFIVELPCEPIASQNSQDDKSVDPVLTIDKIFPNPTSDIVHLQLNAKEYFVESIKLYNSQGQLKYEKPVELFTGNNTIDLNIKTLPKGIYFINVPGVNEELSWHKLIKL